MEINSEIRDRIIVTANQLYQDADRERFPTVDQVRRSARADMNTTSAVMKEWRRQQTAAPAVVAVSIPERVQEAMNTALAEVWSEAQELANESLAAARQAWEVERTDADAMRAELADAYEQQATELESIKQQLAQAQSENVAIEQQRLEQTQALADATARLHDLERREQDARQRIEELRDELADAKTHGDEQERQHRHEVDKIREKLEQQAVAYTDQLAAVQLQRDTATQELATGKARAEAQQEASDERYSAAQARAGELAAELERARQGMTEAREQAAGLAGQLEAITAQNKELMAALKSGQPEKKVTAPKKRTVSKKPVVKEGLNDEHQTNG